MDAELISLTKQVLRFGKESDASRSTSHDDGPSRKGGTLRQIAHELWDVKDEVTEVQEISDSTPEEGKLKAELTLIRYLGPLHRP